jgi:RNA polymerase sigma factor (sigma-70 family)
MAKLIGQALRQALLRLESSPPRGDAELLERFVTRQDEAAFSEIVRLHGPMVWRVCQRVLRQTQDAEDAFQATFVVLARKAESLLRKELLGGWLHGVAYRVALEARKTRGRREGRRQPLLHEPAAPASVSDTESDWRAVLDEEIHRLPARYRLPLVLCDLEGKTSEEAGKQLAIPAGTVRRRLAHIRDRLRQRLTRRGVHFSSAALPAVLAQEASARRHARRPGGGRRASRV